jgi:hypothetical protein
MAMDRNLAAEEQTVSYEQQEAALRWGGDRNEDELVDGIIIVLLKYTGDETKRHYGL